MRGEKKKITILPPKYYLTKYTLLHEQVSYSTSTSKKNASSHQTEGIVKSEISVVENKTGFKMVRFFFLKSGVLKGIILAILTVQQVVPFCNLLISFFTAVDNPNLGGLPRPKPSPFTATPYTLKESKVSDKLKKKRQKILYCPK